MLTAMEDSGSSSEGGPTSRDQPLRTFYASLASRAAARGTLRVGVMHIGQRVAAVQLCLEVYQRLWLLKTAHDDAFSHVSPGLLLTHQSVRFAHEQRLASLEFLGEAAPWQKCWRPVTRTRASALAFPLTARGLSGLALDAISRGARRWLSSVWGMRTSRVGPEL